MSGYLMALTAVFFWSINIIIASYFATTLEPFEIAFGRWFIACLILVPMAWSGLKRNFRLLADNWLLVVSLAITGIVLDNTLIYYAGRTASAIDMGLLDVTGPIFLVILSRIFLKTPISGRQIAGLLIAVFGVLVIILQGDLTQIAHFKFVTGDFIMLLNTFCFAVYSLLQAKRPPQISQPTLLAATALPASLLSCRFYLLSSANIS
ncbi:MAG: DMT family transporter [Alphaproteobacteria bacterium]|nr:DMT family transporter [Alphaproteobacteria bacterium]